MLYVLSFRFIVDYRAAGDFGHPFQKILLCGQSHRQVQPARCPEILSLLLQTHILDHLHDIVHLQITETQGIPSRGCLGNYFSIGNGVGRGGPVGPDQTGNAQFDAAEVSHNHYEYVAETIGINLTENRAAGGRGRLAVISGAEQFALPAYSVGIAMMAGIVVLFLERGDDFPDLSLGLDRVGQGYEPASVVLEKAFGRAGNALVSVDNLRCSVFHEFKISKRRDIMQWKRNIL